MKIRIDVKGTTPLLMHNPRMVDPEFPITRQIKVLTKKRTKTDEDLRQIAKLEWFGGLYEASLNGSGTIVVQPSSKLRKCLVNTGKISKQGKNVERALSFAELFVPLVYDGPTNLDALCADDRFHSRLSVGVGNKRVMRTRPQFFPWALSATGLFVEDAGLNYDDLMRLVELAGVVEGIGDARAIGYGRFTAQVVQL